MGGLFGNKIDTSAADKQAQELARKEKEQKSQLQSQQRAMGTSGKSKTLFNVVLGIDETMGKSNLGQ
jgi:hypothetical protein